MIADIDRVEVEKLPLFPLNIVLFPGGLLPLRIFEPRYLRMVSECLRNQTPFAVASIIDGVEAGGIATTMPRGTVAKIIDWEQHEDGLLGLLCEGEQMFTLGEVTVEHDQLQRAEIVRRPPEPEQEIPEQLEWMAQMLNDLLPQVGPPFDRLIREKPSANHVAGRLIELLPLPLASKQEMFELPDSIARLRRLEELVHPDGSSFNA